MPQIPATFSCPKCGAPLRLRQRPAGTLHLPCPDCAAPLELSDQAGELLVRPAEPERPLKVGSRAPVERGPRPSAAPLVAIPAFKNTVRVIAQRAVDPLVVTWIAAGAATLLIAVAFFRGGSSPSHPVTARPTQPQEAEPPNAKVVPAVAQRDLPPDEPPLAAAPPLRDPEIAAVPDRPAPIAAPKPPASPPIDPRLAIRARLEQRILRFDQPTPVPFDILRLQLEELAGVAIRYDESAETGPRFRDAEITVSLSETTLASILDEVARQADLEPRVDAQGVLLVPASATTQASAGEDSSETP